MTSRATTSPEQKMRAPWELSGMPRQTPVLLALSGGADSRLLLHSLAARAKSDGFALTLVHVNHGIRGAEALRDRAFCERLAREYGLPIYVLDADVPRLAAEHGCGLEEEARRVRYAYFADLMRAHRIPLLATAHHADDNLETLLFRICRGTGLAGLCGISPCRAFGAGYLTRPLLALTRREIEDQCQALALEYVTDSTNQNGEYARNRIRGQVVPILGSLFADPQRRVYEMTEGLREDEEYLQSQAADFLARYTKVDALPLSDLRALPPPIRKRVLMRATAQVTGRTPERVHLSALCRLLDAGTPQTRVALPGDYVAFCEAECLCWLPREQAENTAPAPYRLPVCEGETTIPGGGIAVLVEKNGDSTKIHNLSIESCINIHTVFDIMEKEFYWRPSHPGDRILMGGMHKRLCKLYRAAKIPPRLRCRIPVLCDGEGIVWAPFVGARDGLPQDGASHRICVRFLDGSAITG